MPTVFTHVAVPLAIGLALGTPRISRLLLLAGMAASVLPDLDVVAFKLGINYADPFGHRGALHSLVFAALLAAVAAWAAPRLRATRTAAFFFVLVAAASHGLLDMFTNGGFGIAIAWPLRDQRFFFPWQVIEVSPIGLRFFSESGMRVLMSELLRVWLPWAVAGLLLHVACRAKPAIREPE